MSVNHPERKKRSWLTVLCLLFVRSCPGILKHCFTDKTLEELPTRGVKDVVVICPAFVSDCLETLEEINEEARHSFLRAGGKRFTYIPCLNDHPRWIAVLRRFVRDFEAAREVIDAPDAAAE